MTVDGRRLVDSAVILYDGNPAYPDAGRLWDLAEETEFHPEIQEGECSA